MKLRTTLALLLLGAAPALAQPAAAPLQPAAAPLQPAAAPSQPAAAPAAKFTLDSPIEALVADQNAKGVLDSKLPGLTTNERYEMFKSMSLNQVAGFSPDKLTPDRLKEVEAGLAAIR